MAALKRIRNDDERRATMMQYVEMAHKALGACKALRVRSAPQSPIIHVELAGAQPDMSKSESVLATEKRLQALVDKCMDKGVLLTRAKYADAERARPVRARTQCAVAANTLTQRALRHSRRRFACAFRRRSPRTKSPRLCKAFARSQRQCETECRESETGAQHCNNFGDK